MLADLSILGEVSLVTAIDEGCFVVEGPIIDQELLIAGQRLTRPRGSFLYTIR